VVLPRRGQPNAKSPGGGPLSEQIFDDCCDFCAKVDDTKREVEPCNTMTQRCKGDSCAACKPCNRFVPDLAFVDASKLEKNVRKRKKAPRKAGKLRQGVVQ
jgi:hypothetical protein